MTATTVRKSHIVVLALVLSLLPSMNATIAAVREIVRSGALSPDLFGAEGEQSVIVRGDAASIAWTRDAVGAVGGTVAADLPLIDGVAAKVPASRLAELSGMPGILSVSKNSAVSFSNASYDANTTASNFVRSTGAKSAWKSGKYGQGVGVAVIDTGVSPMADLQGRIVHGPDLSGEGTYIDTYGHGTVMAGLIGGNGADSANRAGGAYHGVAPKSTIVAVKAAGRNGATDVSTMLQAMHWVSAYKDQFNIRVLNLSWGTASQQDPAVDPINYAVQRLWKQGIVVVVAAGNNGPGAATITKPGDDPLAITVGAYDDKHNGEVADDTIPDWGSRGPTAQGLAKPDLVAPGRTLVTTRSYGSTVEQQNPQALVSPSYIKGSGTSEAAAVTSGAIALLLESRPNLTPDQVKALLKSQASPIVGRTAYEQGAGRLQLAGALNASVPAGSTQSFSASGLGSIEASRGGRHVETDCGNDGTVDVIQGEIDVRCEPWNGSTWTGSTWTGNAWTGSTWTGSTWTGSTWTGSTWTGSTWTGSTWTGSTWTGGPWSGNAWTGSTWTGSTWTGSTWTGSTWTGSTWTGSTWTGSTWTGSTWTGSSWTSAQYEQEQLEAPPVIDITYGTAFWGETPPAGLLVVGEVDAATGQVVDAEIAAADSTSAPATPAV